MSNSKFESLPLANYLSDRVQELIIFPTEKCNFRCTYCYEDYEMGRMTVDVIARVKAFLDQRVSNLDYLHISWFGGEPLVAKDIVLDISSHVFALTKKYPELKYSSMMTTNAYTLTITLLSELVKVGVSSYQISLDGPREVHDTTRLRADGKGSFDRIWANLLDIRNSSEPVQITLRVHYDPYKLYYMDQLIRDIQHEFIHDKRFSVFFKSIERLGGPNDNKIKVMSKEEKKEAQNYLYKKLYGSDFIMPENEPVVCYASKPNSLTIRADGSIGKCTVALSDKRNTIGLLRADGSLEINTNRLAPWVRGFSTLDLNALACPLVSLQN